MQNEYIVSTGPKIRFLVLARNDGVEANCKILHFLFFPTKEAVGYGTAGARH